MRLQELFSTLALPSARTTEPSSPARNDPSDRTDDSSGGPPASFLGQLQKLVSRPQRANRSEGHRNDANRPSATRTSSEPSTSTASPPNDSVADAPLPDDDTANSATDEAPGEEATVATDPSIAAEAAPATTPPMEPIIPADVDVYEVQAVQGGPPASYMATTLPSRAGEFASLMVGSAENVSESDAPPFVPVSDAAVVPAISEPLSSSLALPAIEVENTMGADAAPITASNGAPAVGQPVPESDASSQQPTPAATGESFMEPLALATPSSESTPREDSQNAVRWIVDPSSENSTVSLESDGQPANGTLNVDVEDAASSSPPPEFLPAPTVESADLNATAPQATAAPSDMEPSQASTKATVDVKSSTILPATSAADEPTEAPSAGEEPSAIAGTEPAALEAMTDEDPQAQFDAPAEPSATAATAAAGDRTNFVPRHESTHPPKTLPAASRSASAAPKAPAGLQGDSADWMTIALAETTVDSSVETVTPASASIDARADDSATASSSPATADASVGALTESEPPAPATPAIPNGHASPTAFAATSGAVPGQSPADRMAAIERLAQAMHSAEGEGRTLRIQLHPPELGRMQIQVDAGEGGLTAHLQVETAAAQRLLSDSLPQLREQLRHLGASIDRIDIQLTEPARSDSSRDQPSADHQSAPQDQGDRSSQQHGERQNPQERDPSSRNAETDDDAEASLRTPAVVNGTSSPGRPTASTMTSIDVSV